MAEFVPLTDELLYEHPEEIAGLLIPYHIDLPRHEAGEAREVDDERETDR